ELGRAVLYADLCCAGGVHGQAVDGVGGQAVVGVVQACAAAVPGPVHHAHAVGGDPHAAGRVGDDGAVEAARREAFGVTQQPRIAIGDPDHAQVGGHPQRAAGIGDDAEHAVGALRQRHLAQLVAAAVVETAVERAHPQALVAVAGHGGDGRALQYR